MEAKIANKVGAEEVETAIATKADVADVEALESQVATKVDADTVKTMIDEATVGAIEVIEF